jgi:hypothetical protein
MINTQIIRKGQDIYEKIKAHYEPKYRGKFLAIDIETSKAYMADTLGVAMEKAETANPNKSFYLVRIGFDTIATFANWL